MEKVEIESFTLDHTKVKAPYVRLISEEKGPNGDIVSNFDVRLCQPNRQEIQQPKHLTRITTTVS